MDEDYGTQLGRGGQQIVTRRLGRSPRLVEQFVMKAGTPLQRERSTHESAFGQRAKKALDSPAEWEITLNWLKWWNDSGGTRVRGRFGTEFT